MTRPRSHWAVASGLLGLAKAWALAGAFGRRDAGRGSAASLSPRRLRRGTPQYTPENSAATAWWPSKDPDHDR